MSFVDLMTNDIRHMPLLVERTDEFHVGENIVVKLFNASVDQREIIGVVRLNGHIQYLEYKQKEDNFVQIHTESVGGRVQYISELIE